MDYKEKYEQALEALRSLFAEQGVKHCDRVDIKDITNIFPELKESESIRLWLIDLLSTMQYHHCDEDMEMGNKALAWLEAQGDKDKFIEKELGCIKGYRENAIKRLKELEKQSEQIIAYSVKTCKDGQKPAWSEEDEVMLENAISSINHESVIEGLKSRGISYSIDSSIHLMENLIDWLKSLKERYAWKPSEEQMIVLREVINFAADHATEHWNNYIFNVLRELRNQLDELNK